VGRVARHQTTKAGGNARRHSQGATGTGRGKAPPSGRSNDAARQTARQEGSAESNRQGEARQHSNAPQGQGDHRGKARGQQGRRQGSTARRHRDRGGGQAAQQGGGSKAPQTGGGKAKAQQQWRQGITTRHHSNSGPHSAGSTQAARQGAAQRSQHGHDGCEEKVREVDPLARVDLLPGHRRHGDAHHHLRNLQRRDNEVPRRSVRQRCEDVVEVHDRMHAQVHGREPDAPGGAADVRMPAVQQHGRVVVPVQEDDGAALGQKQHSVEQLGDLRHAEQKNPRTRRADRVAAGHGGARRADEVRRGANGPEETVVSEDDDEARHDADCTDHGEKGQRKVPKSLKGAFCRSGATRTNRPPGCRLLIEGENHDQVADADEDGKPPQAVQSPLHL